MLPYDGTAIKDQLAAEGRLTGDIVDPDYDFLDPRLDGLFTEVNQTLNLVGWIHGVRSLSPQLDWAWQEVAVAERMFLRFQDSGLPCSLRFVRVGQSLFSTGRR